MLEKKVMDISDIDMVSEDVAAAVVLVPWSCDMLIVVFCTFFFFLSWRF